MNAYRTHTCTLPVPIDEVFIEALRVEFPHFLLLPKCDSRLCWVIDWGLRIITLGGQRRFLSGYVTCLGQRIYVPDDWQRRSPQERYIVLRHEAVHLRQFRRFTWPGMALLYTLPILPLGLALGRALLERQAYRETLRAVAEVHGAAAAADPALHQHIVGQFTSAAYGWMWPFPTTVARWFEQTPDLTTDSVKPR